MAALGRHPASDLCQQRDQRDLPDIRRLAGHVRSGHQQDLRVVAGQRRVVRHKRLAADRRRRVRRLEHLLHHGMTALGDFQRFAVIHLRAAIIPFAGERRPAGENVQFGQRVGRPPQRRRFGDDRGHQRAEQLQLAGHELLLGVENLLFLLLQCLGDIAFATHRGLTADIIGRHEVKVGLCDFEIIAKHRVETDLQALDSRALLFLALEIRKPGLAVARQTAQAVDLGIVTCADVAAFLEIAGELLGEPAVEKFAQRRLIGHPDPQFVDGGDRRPRQLVGEGRGRLDPLQAINEGGQLGECFPDSAQFTRGPQAVLEASENPRDIPDRPEQSLQFRQERGLRQEFAHHGLPRPDGREIERGRGEPALKQAGARGCGGPIDRAEQRALAKTTGRLEDLQVAQRGGIDEQRLRAAVFLQRPKVLRLCAKILRRIADQGAGGSEAGMRVADAETLQIQHPQRFHDRPGAGRRIEMVARKLRAGAALRERMEGVDGDLFVRRIPPGVERSFRQQQLARVKRGEHRQEILRVHVGGEPEFAGRKIEPGGAQYAGL